jgi:hypothetical protein
MTQLLSSLHPSSYLLLLQMSQPHLPSPYQKDKRALPGDLRSRNLNLNSDVPLPVKSTPPPTFSSLPFSFKVLTVTSEHFVCAIYLKPLEHNTYFNITIHEIRIQVEITERFSLSLRDKPSLTRHKLWILV